MLPKIARVAMLAGAAAVFVNLAFFVLSMFYFADKTTFVQNVGEVPLYSDGDIMHVRLAFAAFTLIVAIAAVGAAAAPFIVGHAIMALMAVGSLAAGVGAGMRGLPGVLTGTEIVLGIVIAICLVFSLREMRAAWSFLVSIAAVYAIVLFFGAPKVRNVLDIGLWTTLVLPGLNVVAMSALILCRQRYRR